MRTVSSTVEMRESSAQVRRASETNVALADGGAVDLVSGVTIVRAPVGIPAR